jgi:hypothetical protein
MSTLEDYLNKKSIKTNLEDSRPKDSKNSIVIITNIAWKTNNLHSQEMVRYWIRQRILLSRYYLQNLFRLLLQS